MGFWSDFSPSQARQEGGDPKSAPGFSPGLVGKSRGNHGFFPWNIKKTYGFR